MRVLHWMVVVLLAFASEGLAQSPAAEPTPASPCQEKPCPSSPPPPDTDSGSFLDRLVLTIGLGVFGDVYPVSSMKAPGTSRGQHSLMGGARFWIGTRLPNRLALRGVFEFGYATVGPFPGRGSDGVIEGAGLEVSLDAFRLLKPFVRFMYNAVVIPIASIASGTKDDTLRSNAFFFQAGVQISIVEVHLAIGRDFAGGVAPGIGFSVNWLY